VIGQNWDWAQSLYPWSSLVRLRTDSMPATLTYACPGSGRWLVLMTRPVAGLDGPGLTFHESDRN
jgi:hypothetical protein